MQGIKLSLGIDDTYTKLYRRTTRADEQTHVKEQIPLVEGLNAMADILHLPTDRFGFCKLLVVVDLATDNFDIEKMKGETAEETLSAYKKILKRGIVKLPYASILTDGGSSFKGPLDKFLYDNGINHRTARAGRHSQLSNVDNLCRQLGDLFNGVMNAKEAETGKQSKAWVHAIDEVRGKLNHYRRSRGVKLPKDITTYEYPIFDNTVPKIKVKKIKKGGGTLEQEIDAPPSDTQKYTHTKPKYKIGDMVNVLYQEPHAMTGKKQPSKNFRMGDLRLEKKKRKVLKVLYYSGPVPFRYLIEGLNNASYTEEEIKQV